MILNSFGEIALHMMLNSSLPLSGINVIKFLRKELDLSPQVTLMLAEIQEQQSLMRTYEITMKKMEAEAERKESDISALRRKLDELVSENWSSEKKLNASGVSPLFDGFKLTSLSPTHFAQVLHYALRSVRHFAKAMARKMEAANWNLDEAIRFIEPQARFAKPGHRQFPIESFVARSIFKGDTSLTAPTAARMARRRRRRSRLNPRPRGEELGSGGGGGGSKQQRPGQPSERRQEVVMVAWRRRQRLTAARGNADGATARRPQRRNGSSDKRWVVVVRWRRDGGE
ncbi:hypothetical protein EUGRSUZ_H02867 [Eucalyptus grandis]|uniref:Uncharacterized protein n=2 Tax=Eucalyptus grandis TaxID=71139 RepID=A0ACC3JTV5_EUCGR|nr:hypothetical protein EUGRSUZ_H02867 [Eucalyptus grandis]